MKNTVLDIGGLAFPRPLKQVENPEAFPNAALCSHPGMTLFDYYAGQALPAIIAARNTYIEHDDDPVDGGQSFIHNAFEDGWGANPEDVVVHINGKELNYVDTIAMDAHQLAHAMIKEKRLWEGGGYDCA